jgi:hypothetical protein
VRKVFGFAVTTRLKFDPSARNVKKCLQGEFAHPRLKKVTILLPFGEKLPKAASN